MTCDLERFEAKVYAEPSCGCWLWGGSLDGDGYGMFRSKGRVERSHRVAWQLYRGEIPPGICVLHRCDNPTCVNLDHLFLGTKADNAWDRAKKGRGRRSKKGLPFGVILRPSGRFGAQYRFRGKTLHFGTYDTADEATRVSTEERARRRNANSH